MSAASPIVVPEQSQQAFVDYHRACYSMLNQQWNLRATLRQRDLEYMREVDCTKTGWQARLANKYGDPTKYQNIVVPVVLPQVESAVTYQSSVFLTGTPIFGWVAPPGQEDQALQFQAITEENQIRGGWISQFSLFFRDCFKYNIGMVSVTWDRINTWAVESDIKFDASGKLGKPKQVVWEGNCIKRWDPYNSFFDTRYKPTEIYKYGEFAGTTEIMSRIHLKKFLAQLPDGMVQNYRRAFESGLSTAGIGTGGIESYYIPEINPESLVARDPKMGFDWMSWATNNNNPGAIQYRNVYEVTTLYARIIPSDFSLNRVPSPSTVQIWKLVFVNHQVLVYAERQTNVHDNLPVLFGQPNSDGLGYQTKSLAENAAPFQAVATALVNSAMAGRRRAVSDRVLYDPSRVSERDMNSDNPAAKIPTRPNAYGKPVSESVYAFPYRDDQSMQAFQELPQVMRMADMVNGQNPARQGQFVKGNKTLHEYDSVMSNANGRDQVVAMGFESDVFTPIKEIIKSNILQYQGATSIYSTSAQSEVSIDPVALKQSMVTFKISDGLVPTDTVISADEFAVALQTIGTSPQIAPAYNIGPMFSYLMKTRNVDITPFEKPPQQVAFEQASQQWMELAQLAVQKGAQVPPQPKPADYGYNPQQQGAPSQTTPTNLTQAAQGRTPQ